MERENKEKRSVLKRIMYGAESQEKLEAHLVDYMQKNLELTPGQTAPPTGEFQKIVEELGRRGPETVMRRQIRLFHQSFRTVRFFQKPLTLFMAVIIMAAVYAVGVFL
ncbi:MAG: hypothetical protein QM657_13865 [Lacrimispora sp.]|uniref:hypothetical protein n=1 Tax=Lacrimispora sp. TaxID=2719234 RepID=UPI0039E72743